MKHIIPALVAVALLGAAGPAAAKKPIVIIEKTKAPIVFPEKKPIIIFEKVKRAFLNPIIILDRR